MAGRHEGEGPEPQGGRVLVMRQGQGGMSQEASWGV